MEPSLLVADEPVSSLDVSLQGQIINLLRELNETLGLTIILISHDLAVVARIRDRVAVMYGGEVVESGSPDKVLATPSHPYTQALLDAVPRGLDRRGRTRTVLPVETVDCKVTLTTMDWNARLSVSRGGGDKSPDCHGVNISRGLAGPFSGLIRHIWTRQWAPNLRGFKQAQSWYQDLTPITVAP